MKQISKISLVLAMVFTVAFAFAPVALAQTGFQVPNQCGQAGLPCETSLSALILRIINIALAIAGLIAVLFLIIGGFRYITSAGNEETAEQARKIITNAIIGIVVIILSFVIVRVISNALLTGQV